MLVNKTYEEVRDYAGKRLGSKGVPQAICETVGDCLAYADARGTTSHGLNMLDAYLERIDHGGIDAAALPSTIGEDVSSLRLDARNGFGQVGMKALSDRLMDKARNVPIVCGTIKNLNHCGALAYFTERVAHNGYIALLFVNANPTVAAFGGMEAAIGTNPMSIALPFQPWPIVLDMASSAVAKGKIYKAARLGEKIDPSWALDSNGDPTDDPDEAINGVLQPMAGPKGYGIAIIVEALAGVMSGAGITGEVSSVHKGLDHGMDAGAFMIVIDPKAFLTNEEYMCRMRQLVEGIKSSKPQPGKTIFLPGEIEARKLKRSMENGIEYDSSFFEP